MRTIAAVIVGLAVSVTAAVGTEAVTAQTASGAPAAGVAPAPVKAPDPLVPLEFLLGEWEAGANTGPHGQGSGTCAFTRSLSDRVILRTNHAEYPASENRPPLIHDDLMVIYASGAGGIEAHYYDSERSLIHYAVSVPGPGQAVFLSDARAGAPRYRLTYKLRDNGTLTGRFEVARTGKPEAFAQYLEWEMHKAAPRK